MLQSVGAHTCCQRLLCHNVTYVGMQRRHSVHRSKWLSLASSSRSIAASFLRIPCLCPPYASSSLTLWLAPAQTLQGKEVLEEMLCTLVHPQLVAPGWSAKCCMHAGGTICIELLIVDSHTCCCHVCLIASSSHTLLSSVSVASVPVWQQRNVLVCLVCRSCRYHC